MQEKNSPKMLASHQILVLLGRHNLEVMLERGSVQKDVDEIFLHPDWKPFDSKFDADLAILVLSDSVAFSSFIQPVCLPDPDEVISDLRGTVVGWGTTENFATNKHELIPHQATTKAMNDSFCYTTNPQVATFSSTRTFCGFAETSNDGSPDHGDSGGGFFALSGISWTQYGIISSAAVDMNGRTKANSYTVYTNILWFLDWITKIKDFPTNLPKRKQTNSNDLNCFYHILRET